MDTTKKPRGRPPKQPDELLIVRSIRLSAEHWKKVDDAGMAELRKLLDRWKPKPNA